MLKRPSAASHPEDFHDLVAEVVDDFDGDAAVFGFIEGAGGVAVEGGQRALLACWTPADLTFSRMSWGRFVLGGGRRSPPAATTVDRRRYPA
jgi:hypothetical protein